VEAFCASEAIDVVHSSGPAGARVLTHSGLPVDLRIVPAEAFGNLLQHFTGSGRHNEALRTAAVKRGLHVSEYGIADDETGDSIAYRTEEEVYERLGLQWIPPELREDRGELAAARKDELPRLIELDDIRGDLHMHTTATDGKATIREMADAARQRGRKYIAITDHSQRVRMANGLDAGRLRKHWKSIEKVRGEISGIEIWKGIECDILENAALDLPDDVLAEADWVLAVLHYGLNQPRAQITKRLLSAIRNPHVDCIGHPTGRMVLARPGADVDFGDVFQAAADHGVMLEINANPHRLDLNDIHAAAAKEHGIPLVISTDAHSTGGLDVMPYGVDQARRAGLEKQDVANTRTPAQFRKLMRRG
ncbi:MAG: PHP domain-containing protein, partial [Planctomycetaceae bacterium]